MMTLLALSLFGCVPDYGYHPDQLGQDEPIDTDSEVQPEDVIEDETPVADAPVYANTSTDLYEVDPLTGVKFLQGSFHDQVGNPVDGMVDIAIDLSGRMFGGTFDALYRIDPTTAQVEKLCNTELRPYALAFTSDGVLFAGAGPDVVEVDLMTCATTPLATSGGYETSGDLVGLPDGYLYWTVEGNNSDELVRVDPSSGHATWMGTVASEDLFGLGYDDGTLYGFSKQGEIVAINPTGGASSITATDPGISWWGATTNPVVWN